MKGPMVSTKICEKLNIVQNRGWKFLHSLALEGLLEVTNGTLGSDETIFGLSEQAKWLFGDNAYTGTGAIIFPSIVYHLIISHLFLVHFYNTVPQVVIFSGIILPFIEQLLIYQ
jgi:hypothetical protein